MTDAECQEAMDKGLEVVINCPNGKRGKHHGQVVKLVRFWKGIISGKTIWFFGGFWGYTADELDPAPVTATTASTVVIAGPPVPSGPAQFKVGDAVVFSRPGCILPASGSPTPPLPVRDPFPHTCYCGAKAFRMALSVECTNTNCRHHVPGAPRSHMSDRGIRDEDLILVRSHDELQAGMTVVLKPCDACSRMHVLILLQYNSGGWHFGLNRKIDPCPSGWRIAGCGDKPGCFCFAILEGRLFRLKPPEDEENPYVGVRAPLTQRLSEMASLLETAQRWGGMDVPR